MSAASSIFIFKSGSISLECAEQLHKELRAFDVTPARIVELTDSSYLKREMGHKNQEILVMPGARDSFRVAYEMNKNGLIERIRHAVSCGWSYFGSCAGANLATQDMLVRQPAETLSMRDLNVPFLDLLPINARIPVYPIKKTNSAGGSNGRIISVISANKEPFQTHWNEGSAFEITCPFFITPEAFYADFPEKPIAAVSGFFGRGPVVALGIHPEFTPDSDATELQRRDSAHRKNFMRKMFGLVHII